MNSVKLLFPWPTQFKYPEENDFSDAVAKK